MIAGCSGCRPERTRVLAADFLSRGCEGLVSFGLCGGLDPGLKPGDLLLSESVIAPDGRAYGTDPDWRQRAMDKLSGQMTVHQLPIVGMKQAVSSVGLKRELARSSGAAAVDMESLGVAVAATGAGKPFLVVRAVADPVRRRIPAWVTKTVAEDGSINRLKVWGGVASHPWTIPALIGLAGESRKAHATLSGVALVLGSGFGFEQTSA